MTASKREYLAETYLEKGDTFYERGDYAEARKAYATVLEIRPDHEEAKQKLAKVGRLLGERIGELDDALEDVGRSPSRMAATTRPSSSTSAPP